MPKITGPSAPSRELEVGFDIIGPLVESPDGNVYKLVGVCATTGVGYSRGMPNKQAATVLKYVNEILVDLRVAHGHDPDVTMRFHSDDDNDVGVMTISERWTYGTYGVVLRMTVG